MAEPKLKRPEDQFPDIGSRLGTAARGVVRSQASQFKDMAKLDAKLKAPLARAGQAVGSNVANFGRTLVGADPIRTGTSPAPAVPISNGGAGGAGSTPQPTANPAAAPVDRPTLLPGITIRAPIQTGAHGERVYNNETLAALGITPSADAAAAGQASSPQQSPVLRAPPPVLARPTTAPAVRESTQRALDGQRRATLDTRADAASILNPMSADAEIMRRFEISQGYGSNKGSPQARKLAGEAILGQLSARNEASATGQEGANATLQQGAAGENTANESAAQRRLEADQFNVESQQTTAQRQAEQQRPFNVVRDSTGRTSVLRNDSVLQPLRAEDGSQLITSPETTGRPVDQVTADAQYKSLSDRLAALQQFGRPQEEGAAAEYDRAVGALQTQMDQLTGAQGRSGQPPAAAIAELRANPDAAADFDAVFGEGAAATYLNR